MIQLRKLSFRIKDVCEKNNTRIVYFRKAEQASYAFKMRRSNRDESYFFTRR